VALTRTKPVSSATQGASSIQRSGDPVQFIDLEMTAGIRELHLRLPRTAEQPGSVKSSPTGCSAKRLIVRHVLSCSPLRLISRDYLEFNHSQTTNGMPCPANEFALPSCGGRWARGRLCLCDQRDLRASNPPESRRAKVGKPPLQRS
jgi:hypothetical protein